MRSSPPGFLSILTLALLCPPALRGQEAEEDLDARTAARAYLDAMPADDPGRAGLVDEVVALGLLGPRHGSRLACRRAASLRYARPAERADASRAIDAMYDELRPRRMAFFEADVRALAADRRVDRFLDDLIGRLEDPEGDVDLWRLTLAHVDRDEAEAIRWLAAIFQDLEITPVGPLHLIGDREVRERWAVAIVLLERSDPRRVRLYPDGVDLDGRWLYHYYVPALLASRLRAAGHRPRMAFLAPFVMNTEYEIFNLLGEAASDDGGPSPIEALGLLWAPPAPFDEIRTTDDARREAAADIYLGYRGARRGAGRDASPATFEDVERGLRTDPAPLLRRLAAGVGD